MKNALRLAPLSDKESRSEEVQELVVGEHNGYIAELSDLNEELSEAIKAVEKANRYAGDQREGRVTELIRKLKLLNWHSGSVWHIPAYDIQLYDRRARIDT